MTRGSDLPADESVRGSFAVLDLGTNTLRLLIASLNPHQQLIRHLLSGRQEGAHTLAGVRAGLGRTAAAPSLVVDVGGGSTESARIAPDGSVSVQSVPLGAVYLKESVGGAYPVRPADLAALRHSALRAVRGLDLATGSSASPCIGTGGSITTLAWIALGLTQYDPAKIHGAVLTQPVVERVLSEALHLPCEALMGRYGLEPGRADLVVFGCVITAEIIRRLPGGCLQVSDYGLLEGIARTALTAREAGR